MCNNIIIWAYELTKASMCLGHLTGNKTPLKSKFHNKTTVLNYRIKTFPISVIKFPSYILMVGSFPQDGEGDGSMPCLEDFRYDG